MNTLPEELFLPEESTRHALVPTTSNVTVSDATRLMTSVDFTLWNIMPPVFLIFGTFGNVMTVLVVKGMLKSSNTACLAIYFIALAVSDQCGLTAAVPYYWGREVFTWPRAAFRYNILCPIPKCIWNLADITSAWYLVAMTFQRVTSVVAPHRVGILCTAKTGKIVVFVIFLAAFLLNFHFLFTWHYSTKHGRCYYREQYVYLRTYFEYEQLLCYVLLPYLFLIVGNSILIWNVMKSVRMSRAMIGGDEKQAEARKDQAVSMSVTLIVTSSAFLVLLFPICFMNVYKKMNVTTSADSYDAAVLSLVWTFVLHSWFGVMSSNFYFYMLSGRKFRAEAKRYIFCKTGNASQGVV